MYLVSSLLSRSLAGPHSSYSSFLGLYCAERYFPSSPPVPVPNLSQSLSSNEVLVYPSPPSSYLAEGEVDGRVSYVRSLRFLLVLVVLLAMEGRDERKEEDSVWVSGKSGVGGVLDGKSSLRYMG